MEAFVIFGWVMIMQITEDELKRRISNLNVWKKQNQRAPHKPLLVLLALAEFQRGEKILPYAQTRAKLKSLLMEFGPLRRSYHPEQPFVRLTSDGIWMLSKTVDRNHFTERGLLLDGISGGFSLEVLELLENRPNLVPDIAVMLLHAHFPDTMHQDIMDAVGLELTKSTKRRRDPEFRNRILKAYEYKCAICGFNVRLGNQLVGIDAAHIQWHQAGGPDHEDNGIALCSLHHKLFDRGVFTITHDRRLIVAEEAHGTTGFDEWLMKYHGKEIHMPINPLYLPQIMFLEWHVREVFKGPARYNGQFNGY